MNAECGMMNKKHVAFHHSACPPFIVHHSAFIISFRLFPKNKNPRAKETRERQSPCGSLAVFNVEQVTRNRHGNNETPRAKEMCAGNNNRRMLKLSA
jgi:hypothetical protein